MFVPLKYQNIEDDGCESTSHVNESLSLTLTTLWDGSSLINFGPSNGIHTFK